MSRKSLNLGLSLLLICGIVFTASSCSKLSVSRLQGNYHFNNANQHFKDGKYRDAIDSYTKALENNPELTVAYRFLGESYKQLYKPAVETERNKEIERLALEALTKAYELEPTNKEIIFSLGDMYDKMRDFDEAEKLYLKILDMEPTNMDNYYVVAEFYKRYAGGTQEEEEEGEEGEEKIKKKNPQQKAEEMYLRRIETDPENPQGYAYIAQFYGGISPIPDFDRAHFYHLKRTELEPENAEAWLSVGVNRWSKAYRMATLPKNARIELARVSETALLKAKDLDPAYPEPYSWLGVLYKSVLAKLIPERANRYNEDADRYLERFQELRKRQAERRKLEQELTSGEER